MSSNYQKIINESKNIIDNDINDNQMSLFIENLVNGVKKQPFLFSYLRDIINTLQNLEAVNSETQIKLLKTLIKRLNHFHHWEAEENATIKLIDQSIIKTNEIKPHIRCSDLDYKTFYINQNSEFAKRLKNQRKEPFNTTKSHLSLKFKNNYAHIIRKSHALNIIETYMAILENLSVSINKKWLDIGCGNGFIANAVNPQRYAKSEWEIQGCDLQKNKIQTAKNRATNNRQFYQEDVLEKLKTNNIKKTEYDIISMFEFCEHFADPFSLLKDISKNNFKIMVISTPLAQKINKINDSKPDPVHLWSFTSIAIIKMLQQINLNVVYHSEIGVGRYTKGLDWLTVVAAKPEIHNLLKVK